MSRHYEMAIQIGNCNANRKEEIQDAIKEEWDIDTTYGVHDKGGDITFYGKDYLSGGESEEEFARRIAKIIFKANHGPCDVQVTATYLEDLPSDSYDFDEDEVAEIIDEICAECGCECKGCEAAVEQENITLCEKFKECFGDWTPPEPEEEGLEDGDFAEGRAARMEQCSDSSESQAEQ